MSQPQMSEYKVPLRVSFTGVATDIPRRIGRHTGYSICAAIDKYVRVSITTNNHEPPFIEPKCDLIDSLLAKIPFAADMPRMQIRWDSDIPLGNGLGGSAALLVAVASHFFHNPLHQASVAGAVEMERGAGWQDGAICAYGGCRVFQFRHDYFSLSETFCPPSNIDFMLVSTNKTHDTAKQYKNPTPFSQEQIEDSAERVRVFGKALRNNDVVTLGHLLNETYDVKNRAPNYVTPEMESFYREALKNGAYGGKVMGSGGGGHFIFCVDAEDRKRLRKLAQSYGYDDVPFRFLSERETDNLTNIKRVHQEKEQNYYNELEVLREDLRKERLRNSELRQENHRLSSLWSKE